MINIAEIGKKEPKFRLKFLLDSNINMMEKVIGRNVLFVLMKSEANKKIRNLYREIKLVFERKRRLMKGLFVMVACGKIKGC
jgi:hypothetical protein